MAEIDEKTRIHEKIMDARVAIVMVSHNGLNETCLKSLARVQAASRLKTKVVIVDNASTEYRANELVAKHLPEAIVVLRDRNYGFGSSCNRGAQEVEADYYFFLNPDTLLTDPLIIDTLHDYIEARPRVGIVAPKITYFDGRRQDTCRRFPAWYMPFVQRTSLKDSKFGKTYADRFMMADYDHAEERPVDWVQGSAMFVHGRVWKILGGFDDRYFMYFEDVDLCRRTSLLGQRVVYLPATSLHHAYSKESARIPGLLKNLFYNKMARAHLQSWAKYVWKWRGQPEPSV
jgi:hypothetical protein